MLRGNPYDNQNRAQTVLIKFLSRTMALHRVQSSSLYLTLLCPRLIKCYIRYVYVILLFYKITCHLLFYYFFIFIILPYFRYSPIPPCSDSRSPNAYASRSKHHLFGGKVFT